MKFLISTLLLVCVACTLGASVPQKPQLNAAEERDSPHHGGGGGGGGHHGGGGGHHGGGGGGGGGHSVSSSGYGAPPKKTSYVADKKPDTGYYYYYYPVVPQKQKKPAGIFNKGKGMFGKMVETIMYPIMYPIMRMYDYFDGRSISSRAYDSYPGQIFGRIVEMLETELYKEDCLSRIICNIGKSTEDYGTFIQLGEFFLDEKYQKHMRTYSEGLNKNTLCESKYSCKSLDTPKKKAYV